MRLPIFLTVIFIPCLSVGGASGQNYSDDYDLEGEFDPMLIGTTLLHVNNTRPAIVNINITPLPLNSSDTLELVADYENESLSGTPDVHLTVMYGDQTSSIELDNELRPAKDLFCFESRPNFDKITVVARSREDAQVRINVRRKVILLPFDEEVNRIIRVGESETFLINPQALMRTDSILLKVVTNNHPSYNVCMIVAAYSNMCPFKDESINVQTADMWMTVLQKGAMTIRKNEYHFNMPFYLSFVVLESDAPCRLPGKENPNFSSYTAKNVTLSIVKNKPYSEYVAPIMFMLLICTIIAIIGCACMGAKNLGDYRSESANSSVYYSPNGSMDLRMRVPNKPKKTQAENDDNEIDVVDRDEVDQPIDENGSTEDRKVQENLVPGNPSQSNQANSQSFPETLQNTLQSKCRHSIPVNSSRRDRIEKGLDRLVPNAKLDTMIKILQEDKWFRRNRSRVYCYLVPLLSLFYFIPSIQFVFLASESKTGSLDVCFHNFECSKPHFIFADFNHVISSCAYMLFGTVYILLVYYKSTILPIDKKPKNDHRATTGILQQLSIFYAMGFALIAQGFFSICYHVCPTNRSLQFDSTMMYVMCMLGLVKIYQFRHPDANANAYSFFYFLGAIVLLEAIALYSESWWIYGLFILFYVIMTFFIAVDCYYMGVGRLDKHIRNELTKNIFRNCHRDPNASGFFEKLGILYPKRFGFALVFCLLNFAHAVFIAVGKYHNPRKTVTHVVLLILAGNLFLYILYYVIRKNVDRMKNFYQSCCGDDNVDAKYQVKVLNHHVTCPLSVGILYAVSALILGGFAIVFYVKRNANRNLSPAESRNLNGPCEYMDFFDNHDMWHFVGSAATFMAFLALLTVDDDLLLVPRENIEVF